MNAKLPLFAGALLLSYLPGAASAAQVYYPHPSFVSKSSGLMESLVASGWYRGSATVTRDPRLIYSCAHLFYDSGQWASDYVFHRAYDSKNYPADGTGVTPRGFHYFSSYSSGVSAHGQDSNQAFASDFTVFYGNSSFGPAVGWWPNGAQALKSSSFKRIVGYPADIDYTGGSGHCYQHSTDWFANTAYRVLGSYYEFSNVSTGPGNSGGPVFVQDDVSGNDYLAGILVSGTRTTAGVMALDLNTDTMAGYSLGLKDKTVTFSNTTPLLLPDASGSFSVRSVKVSGFTGAVQKLKLTLAVDTTHRGDLEIYLRSPGGHIRWIIKRSGSTAQDLYLDNADYSKDFYGVSPNGKWEIWMRDALTGDRATFRNASITVSAL